MDQAKYAKTLSRLLAAGAVGASFTMALLATAEAKTAVASGEPNAGQPTLESMLKLVRKISVEAAPALDANFDDSFDDSYKDAFHNVHDKSNSPT